MKHILILCFLILQILNLSGQSQNTDSLENVLSTQELSEKEQVNIYKRLSNAYRESNIDKFTFYTKKILEHSLKNNDLKNVGLSYYLIGDGYHTKGSFDSASIYYGKALDILLEINEEFLLTGLYINLGALASDSGNLTDALAYYLKGLSIAERTDDVQQQIRLLGNIGVLYQRMDNMTHALEFFEKNKILAEEADLPNEKCSSYFYLGSVYRNLGRLDEALEYVSKSLELSRSTGYKTFEVMSLITIAQIYYSNQFKEYDKAEKYATESLDQAIEYGDVQLLINSYGTLSDIYRIQKRYEECNFAASKAWEFDTTNFLIGKDLVTNIAYANIYLDNKDKAARFLTKLNFLSREINDRNIESAIVDMEVKYETEKKEMRIASLEKERLFYVWITIAGVMLLASFGVALWFKMRSSRKERQLIASNAVQEGEMSERERIATELHDRLLGSLSALKSETDHTAASEKLNRCIEEVRRISRNLMPLPLRFGIKTALEDFTAQFANVRFHFFGQEKHIEKRIEFIVYCCASELVTNSIRHSGAKNINVQLVQSDNHFALTVQDDGCGFEEKTITQGIGLKSIQDRVASCNGKIEIFSSLGKGTETIIEINI